MRHEVHVHAVHLGVAAAASARAAQRIGAACPLESTSSWFSPESICRGSQCITSKNRVLMISAADRHEVGWPEPAFVVMVRECGRS